MHVHTNELNKVKSKLAISHTTSPAVAETADRTAYGTLIVTLINNILPSPNEFQSYVSKMVA